MIKSSLCSVTFRKLKPEKIIQLVSQAGLEAIEWGGDIHVPPDQQKQAKEISLETKRNGLLVSEYGSYYVAGENNSNDLRKSILDTAEILETNTVRVWAGNTGSAATKEEQRRKIEDDLSIMVYLASERNLRIATEFHQNTLTDTADSTIQLLNHIPGLFTLWQPPEGWTDQQNLESLKCLNNRIANFHVYKLDSNRNRLPLSYGEREWTNWLSILDQEDIHRYATLEFVINDDPEKFLEDAGVLNKILEAIQVR